ncbi:MAG: energy-coupling factor transporter transmembrane protein EcfT, partial [Tissierellia bacterium]|nr:energy-coupling factor transporter transmembrane protein EcfT [Tissierellia bacterium]
MLKDITIGQYFPGTSFIHKLDPRIKIIVVALFIASLFFVTNFIPYIFIVLFIGLVIYVAKLPLKFIIKGLRPLVFIILITFAIN